MMNHHLSKVFFSSFRHIFLNFLIQSSLLYNECHREKHQKHKTISFYSYDFIHDNYYILSNNVFLFGFSFPILKRNQFALVGLQLSTLLLILFELVYIFCRNSYIILLLIFLFTECYSLNKVNFSICLILSCIILISCFTLQLHQLFCV